MQQFEDDFDDQPHYAVRPNKSAIKRESAGLETLGEELIALPKDRLDALALPDELQAAIRLAQQIANHRIAFKRQRKFIAKLLREIDVSPIREQLDPDSRRQAQAVHQLHQVEAWRDRLLNGGDQDLNALMAEHPQAERQKLRTLIRAAHKEQETQAPLRSARLLFKYLRELLVAADAEAHASLDEAEE